VNFQVEIVAVVAQGQRTLRAHGNLTATTWLGGDLSLAFSY